MKITIFSDYVCPFCYIGKTALFKALEGLETEIEFHPYQLRRYPDSKVDPMHDEKRLKRFEEVIQPIARELGIEMKLPWISPHPYSTLAFQGYYFAQEHGLGMQYNDAVFHAFYVEEQDIGNLEILKRIMMDLELDVAAFEEAVNQKTYLPLLNQQDQIKETLGIKGVPTFIINNKRITGYHSVAEFTQLIADEFAEELSGMACGSDGCKIETRKVEE